MAKQKINPCDWLTLQCQVTKVWDGEITIAMPNGNRETISADSDEIVEVTKGEKPSRRRSLFDKQD